MLTELREANKALHDADAARSVAARRRREVIATLRKHGMTSRQIGEAVGMSTAAVDMALSRGRGGNR